MLENEPSQLICSGGWRPCGQLERALLKDKLMSFSSDAGDSDLVEGRESSSLQEHIDKGGSVEEVLDILNLDGSQTFGCQDISACHVVPSRKDKLDLLLCTHKSGWH